MDLIRKIEQWGEDRGFYHPEHGTTIEGQFLKLTEEMGELASDIVRGRSPKDSIGDIVVVLVGIEKLNGTYMQECMEHAYNEIKDRKGKMVNRIFVKEEDLNAK